MKSRDPKEIERRLELMASSSIVGADVRWALDEIAELRGRLGRIQQDYALVHSAGAEAAARAKRSTQRLAELSEPGSIGAFAARDAAVARADAAEADAARYRWLKSNNRLADDCDEKIDRHLGRAKQNLTD